jgi:hypothetical protein
MTNALQLLLVSVLAAPAIASHFHDGHPAVCAAGDLDGDGCADFYIASRDDRGPETVWAFSGKQGRLLWGIRTDDPGDGFGRSMANIGDVDGDGIPDVVIASPENVSQQRYPRPGRVRVVSGKNGRVLREIVGDDLFGTFGSSLGDCLDGNGHGTTELLVGCPGASPARVRKYSAGSGRLLLELTSPRGDAGSEAFGEAVSEIGDVDGDGIADIAVGDPGAIRRGQDYPESPEGCVRLYSGATGALLHSIWSGIDREKWSGHVPFGCIVQRVGDFDGDGCPDLCLAGPDEVVRVFSSRSLAMLRRIPNSPAFYPPGGFCVAAITGATQPALAIGTFGGIEIASCDEGVDRLTVYHSESNGVDVGSPGDLDGDGVPDLVLSVVGPWNFDGRPRAQQVRAWSTRTRSTLYDIYGDALRSLKVSDLDSSQERK